MLFIDKINIIYVINGVKVMKKNILIGLICLISIIIVGCGGGGNASGISGSGTATPIKFGYLTLKAVYPNSAPKRSSVNAKYTVATVYKIEDSSTALAPSRASLLGDDTLPYGTKFNIGTKQFTFVGSGIFDYIDHSGILKVVAGKGYTLFMGMKDADGNTVQSGIVGNISVLPDKTSDSGTVEVFEGAVPPESALLSVGISPSDYESALIPPIVQLPTNLSILNTTTKVFQTGISGTVTDQITGQPVEGAGVFILNTDKYTATDANGYFEFLGLSPGTYTIIIKRDGYTDQTIQNIIVQ